VLRTGKISDQSLTEMNDAKFVIVHLRPFCQCRKYIIYYTCCIAFSMLGLHILIVYVRETCLPNKGYVCFLIAKIGTCRLQINSQRRRHSNWSTDPQWLPTRVA